MKETFSTTIISDLLFLFLLFCFIQIQWADVLISHENIYRMSIYIESRRKNDTHTDMCVTTEQKMPRQNSVENKHKKASVM